MTQTIRDTSHIAALAVCGALALAGCEEEEEAAATTSTSAADPTEGESAEPEGETGGQPDLSGSPCDVLTEEMVRTVFGIDPGTAVTQAREQIGPNDECEYEWELGEEAQQAAAELARGAEPTVEGVIDVSNAGEAGKAMLAIPDLGLESAEEADSRFDSNVEMLASTFENESGPNTVPVDDVGDEAVWVPRGRVFYFRVGKHILNIEVRRFVDNDRNLEHARRLAQAIIG